MRRKKGVAILVSGSELSFRHRMFSIDLKHQGYPVFVLLWGRSDDGKVIVRKSESQGMNIITIMTSDGKGAQKEYLKLLKQTLRNLASRVDTLVLTEQRHLRHLLFAKNKFTLIYDAGELSLPSWAQKSGPVAGVLGKGFEAIERKLIKMLKVKAVVVSGARENSLPGIKKVCENSSIVLTVPALSQSAKAEDREVVRKKLGNKKFVAVTGELMAYGELEYALDVAGNVASCYDDVFFLFFGRSCADQRTLKRMISDRRLEGRAHFLPKLAYKKMMAYLENASVGLVLAGPDGAPTNATADQSVKLFSYMQAGIPVVGPAFCMGGYVAREAGCGMFVDTSSPVDVAGAVAYMLTHPDEARSKGLKGRDAFEKKYNWEHERQNFISIMDSIA